MPAAVGLLSPSLPAQGRRNKMGIATTSYMTVRRFRDTLEFLGAVDDCRSRRAFSWQ